jgi:transketolase
MDFKAKHPDRFVECFIAEQNMLGVALGLSKQGKMVFVSTFAAFLTRAFDQIRMSAVSLGDVKICGSHAGVSIGEDGPSQMGLEDIAMFAAIPNSTIFHPSDAVSAEKLVFEQARTKGISYLRTLRPKTLVLYDNEEEFMTGGSKVLRESENDEVVIVAAGITVHEALKAHQNLQDEGINIAVIDAYSVKPIDKTTIVEKAHKSKKKMIISVEDHYYHGGLGDMVLNAVASENIRVEKLAVTDVSHSGKADELLAKAGVNAASIVSTVKQSLK